MKEAIWCKSKRLFRTQRWISLAWFQQITRDKHVNTKVLHSHLSFSVTLTLSIQLKNLCFLLVVLSIHWLFSLSLSISNAIPCHLPLVFTLFSSSSLLFISPLLIVFFFPPPSFFSLPHAFSANWNQVRHPSINSVNQLPNHSTVTLFIFYFPDPYSLSPYFIPLVLLPALYPPHLFIPSLLLTCSP